MLVIALYNSWVLRQRHIVPHTLINAEMFPKIVLVYLGISTITSHKHWRLGQVILKHISVKRNIVLAIKTLEVFVIWRVINNTTELVLALAEKGDMYCLN